MSQSTAMHSLYERQREEQRLMRAYVLAPLVIIAALTVTLVASYFVPTSPATHDYTGPVLTWLLHEMQLS
jgi:hypothetical protein